MVYILEYLNGVHSVAWLQYHLGVRWRYPLETEKYHPDEKQAIHDSDTETHNEFVIKNKLIYYFCQASSELAGHTFYETFFPSSAWLFDFHLGRQTTMMLSLMMYIGQALKDIFRQPRPKSPPVIRVEGTYATEYGMPSTHSLAALCFPFSFLMFLSHTHSVGPAHYCLAALWTSSVVFSRLYLGMHTILQTICGLAIPAVSIKLMESTIVTLDDMQMNGSNCLTYVMCVTMFFVCGSLFFIDNSVDPLTNKRRWTTSPGDTTEILAWCTGFLVGTRWISLNPPAKAAGGALLQAYFDESAAFRCLFRFLTGAIFLAPTSLLLRKLLTHLFVLANGAHKMKLYRSKKLRLVEWPYKFFAVFGSALIATCLVPTVYHKYGVW